MNKVAVILGAGPGVGYGVAEKFGSEGFKVVLVGRTKAKLDEMSNKLNMRGIDAHVHVGDLSDGLSVKKVMEHVMEHDGVPEMILFNAFKFDNKSLMNEDWSSVQASMNVNAGAAFHLIQMMLPQMQEQKRGKLFFTGGGFALSGEPNYMALSLGKAALRNLVQAAHKVAKGSRVHVGMVTIDGYVKPDDPKHNPGSIAEEFWNLYEQEPDGYSAEIIY